MPDFPSTTQRPATVPCPTANSSRRLAVKAASLRLTAFHSSWTATTTPIGASVRGECILRWVRAALADRPFVAHQPTADTFHQILRRRETGGNPNLFSPVEVFDTKLVGVLDVQGARI